MLKPVNVLFIVVFVLVAAIGICLSSIHSACTDANANPARHIAGSYKISGCGP